MENQLMKASEIDFMIENCPYWNALSQEEQELQLSHTDYVIHKKGTTIHSGENSCVGILLVKKGVLRTYILSEDGREVTLFRLYPKDVCILSASCTLDPITFDVHVDAETDCEVYATNTSAFSKLEKNNIYVQNFSYKTATERFSDVIWSVQQILFMRFDKRLAIFLLDELAKTQDEALHYTHEQIAKYMGSAREVVTRMLKYFSEEKIVELSRGCIKILDKNTLRKIIEV
jgi:CRP/FNR family transcriptional regulator, anaerobic regulatory protein